MNLVRRALSLAVAACVCFALPFFGAEKKGERTSQPLTLIVMDPLARELACACVKGFGQRDYRKVSALLSSKLDERVGIEFSDDLADTLELIGGVDGEYLVIGDQSVVTDSAKKAGLQCKELCRLTDRDGNTDLGATIIVRSDDPARELKDIAGRKLFIGFAESDAKFKSVMAMLGAGGVDAKPAKHLEYNIAALDLLDSEASPLPVAILPSYGLALLEGCGSVRPRSLRVLAKAPAVPFITAFLSDNVPEVKRNAILNALLELKNDPLLLEALESKNGFQTSSPHGAKESAAISWPDWRGPARDGRVARLPEKLQSTPRIVWKKGAVHGGLAGLSVSDGRLLVAERDLADEQDVYRCFNAEDGELIWRVGFPAKGNLDYGNAQRAAPVIREGRAFLLSAFGDLRCVDMVDGKVIWHRQLTREFSARLPTWGMCSPPLIVENMLVVNPGSTNASIAALDLETGHTRWTAPGGPAAYGAFIQGVFGGKEQVIGYDQRSLGGWDPSTGTRLWKLVPEVEGDFNVPTPIPFNGGLIVTTENNGTRFYRFKPSGEIDSKPVATFKDLAHDTSTPVLVNDRLFGVSRGKIYCLNANSLEKIWALDEENLGDHSALIADDDRVLVMTIYGELVLLDAKADSSPVISRMNLFDEDVEIYAHPAVVGSRLFARGGSSVICVDLMN